MTSEHDRLDLPHGTPTFESIEKARRARSSLASFLENWRVGCRKSPVDAFTRSAFAFKKLAEANRLFSQIYFHGMCQIFSISLNIIEYIWLVNVGQTKYLSW